MKNYSVAMLQPNLPSYRIDFIKKLRTLCSNNLSYYFSKGKLGSINSNLMETWVYECGEYYENKYFHWQSKLPYKELLNHDVIILAGNPRNIQTLIITLVARIRIKKVIWINHFESGGHNKVSTAIRHYLMYILPSKVIFYNRFELDRAHKMFGKHKSKFYEMSNGLDYLHIDKFRTKYDAKSRSKILFIGRIISRNKIDTLLAVASKMPEQEFIIIGDGVISGYNDKLHNVKHVCGTSDEKRISEYFNQAKIFISIDSAGLNLIHAACYGVPVLINNNRYTQGPESDLYLEAEIGCKHNGTVAGIICEINRMNSEPEKLNLFSSNLIDLASKKYNTAIMSRKVYEAIYD